jgi:hypothetical protein
MIKRLYSLIRSYQDPRDWIPNIAWRFPQSTSDLAVIFVVGAPRSGTTLLQNILACHSALCSIEKETGIFSFQNLFSPTADPFGLGQRQTRELQTKSRDIVNYFEKGVKVLVEKSGGNKIFVEKTPQHVNYLSFILKYFPEAKIIHIVRDGRDCYCSARQHAGFIPQSTNIKTFAKYWKKCVSNPIRFASSPGLLTVVYEDLVIDPKASMENIMSFIGLPFEETQLDFTRYGNDQRAKWKEFSRLNSSISGDSRMRWRYELNDDEKFKFKKIAQPELEYYGYEGTVS